MKSGHIGRVVFRDVAPPSFRSHRPVHNWQAAWRARIFLVSTSDHPGSNLGTRHSQVWYQALSVLGHRSPHDYNWNSRAVDIILSISQSHWRFSRKWYGGLFAPIKLFMIYETNISPLPLSTIQIWEVKYPRSRYVCCNPRRSGSVHLFTIIEGNNIDSRILENFTLSCRVSTDHISFSRLFE